MLHGAAAQAVDAPAVAKKPAPHSSSVTGFGVDPSVFAAQVLSGGFSSAHKSTLAASQPVALAPPVDALTARISYT
jgi:hypothetical protein